jgi:hypothetical protein
MRQIIVFSIEQTIQGAITMDRFGEGGDLGRALRKP